MVEVRDTSVAYPAVFRSERSETSAGMTKTIQDGVSLLPLVKVGNLLDGTVVGIGIQRQIAWITTVCYDPADPHHDVPEDEAVVGSAEDVPRYRDALKYIKILEN